MNIIEFYRDNSIETAPEGHKHSRDGWINIECPFCTGENPGYHLGYNVDGNYFYCWRCGGKMIWQVISKLLNVSKKEAIQIIASYGGKTHIKQPNVIIRRKAFKLPSGTGVMEKRHKKYLEKRNFDADWLEKTWGLLGSGPISKLDDTDYKHRIIIPFYWNGKIVTFQGRDITDKHKKKYLACPKEREVIHHKDILFGDFKENRDRQVGLIVEGVFDVFRLGVNSYATMGIEWTRKQCRVISQMFERTFILFDPERQAQEQAQKLASELRFRGKESQVIKLDKDPGEMFQEEADYLVKQLKQ